MRELNEMKTKWFIWQFVILTLILISWYYNWRTTTIILLAFELLVLYTSFRKKEKNQYCLPAGMAKGLKKVSIETQYESSILGTFLILIGLIASGIYSIFFLKQDWWFKGLIIFNLISAIILLTSQLTTTYQQYNSYKETKEFMDKINKETFTKNKK